MPKVQGYFQEVVTGVFVAAVIALLAFFTIVISGVDLLRGSSTVLRKVRFENIGALKVQDPVFVRGMKVVNALVVFNLFFTGGLIPQYMLYRDLNLLGSYWVMVIPGALNITYFIIMRNYFTYSVPKELEEAALIDGCTEVGVFFRIVTPVSRSMLAAVALFIAVINWNDYYNYMMFISNKTNLQPFVWILRRMLVDQSMMNTVRRGAVGLGMQLPPPMALRMATIICAMVPIMCVYPFLQKYFTSGITLGAIKE